MPICTKCGESKPETEFYFNKTAQRIYHSCKECHKELTSKYYSENSEKCKKWSVRNLQKSKRRNKDFLWEMKKKTPCTDCGRNFHPIAMQFDHVRGTKRFEISEMSFRGFSLGKILKEIEKCEIVCTNCHLIRSHNRRNSISENSVPTKELDS